MDKQDAPSAGSVRSTVALPSAWDLVKLSWRVYREHFPLFAGTLIPIFIVSGFILFLGLFPSLPTTVFSLLIGFIGFLVSLWVGVSLVFAVHERRQGIVWRDALAKGKKTILSYWWISVLQGLITAGGLLLFIVPGLIVSVWFSLVSYVLVAEGKKGMTALLYSKHLVSGYWWQAFGRFVVLGAVVLSVALLFLAVGLGTGLFHLEDLTKTDEPALPSPVGAIVQFLRTGFQWLLAIFVVIFGYLLYASLRDAKKDIPFVEPSRSTKVRYLLLGIIPIVGALLLAVLFAVVASPYLSS